MNQEQNFDILSDLDVPSWMIQNINNLQDPSIFLQSQPQSVNISDDNFLISFNDTQRIKPRATYEIYSSDKPSDSMIDFDQSSGDKPSLPKNSLINKKQYKNLQERRNQTSRKYRERKKQKSKQIENQNKFLRFKVDELTFRLQEVTSELNKIKNNSENLNLPNYHKIKSECFEELQKMLQSKIQDISAYTQIEQRLNSVIAFDGKQKIDLLNYFMSQLMENVISDKCFYFIDCLINKKGVHRPNDSVKLTKLDAEIFQMMKVDPKKVEQIRKIDWQTVNVECKKFQSLWKTLYQVYLAILNQGFKIQRGMQRVKFSLQKHITPIDMLKLELFFEKNKFRSDIREMRNLWFRELEREKYPKEWKKLSNQ